MRDSKVQIIPFDGDQRYLRLLGGIPQTRGMRSGYVVLQPGESVGEHSTQDKEEAVIVLEGSVQVVADGQAAGVARKGQLVYIPPRTSHDLSNEGNVAARYVYVAAPVNEHQSGAT